MTVSYSVLRVPAGTLPGSSNGRVQYVLRTARFSAESTGSRKCCYCTLKPRTICTVPLQGSSAEITIRRIQGKVPVPGSFSYSVRVPVTRARSINGSIKIIRHEMMKRLSDVVLLRVV